MDCVVANLDRPGTEERDFEARLCKREMKSKGTLFPPVKIR